MNLKIRLYARFVPRMRLMAFLMGILVSLATPVTYFMMNMREQRISANYLSQEVSEKLKATVKLNPELWKYSVVKFMRVFDEMEGREIAFVRIYDENGGLLDGSDFGNPYKLKVQGKSDIVYNNVVFGHVEVDKIADSTLSSSLVLFAIFCLLGAGTSLILFRYPSGIIKASEGRIEDMIGRLNIEIKERTAKEAALAETLEEKEILLREIHHRVKNNLQLIASLISLRMNRLERGETRDLLQNIKYKIYAMARVHEHLYQDSTLSVIDMGSYLTTIVREIRNDEDERKTLIRYSVDSGGISLSLDRAMPVGLIVNELLLNSQKYAFPERKEGRIEVRLERTDEGRARLTVSDDGVGMPLESADSRGNNLGFLLVKSLTAQLGGELKLESSSGLKVIVDRIKIAD